MRSLGARATHPASSETGLALAFAFCNTVFLHVPHFESLQLYRLRRDGQWPRTDCVGFRRDLAGDCTTAIKTRTGQNPWKLGFLVVSRRRNNLLGLPTTYILSSSPLETLLKVLKLKPSDK
jgi:hypothetical protein